MKRTLLLLLFAVCAAFFTGCPATAQKFTVRVVGITDGDTFTAINRDSLRIYFRLLGVDAPERGQDYYNRAKQALSDLIFGKDIVVDVVKTEKWGRYLARAYTPDGKDVSLLMLEKGLAWYYEDRKPIAEYDAACERAKAGKVGLWSQPSPIAPKDKRKKK